MSANLNTEIRAAIEQLIATTFPITPIAWENVPFNPPNALWLRVSIGYGGEAPVAVRRDALVGALVVEVFTPFGQGSNAALVALESIKTIFYRKRVSNIYFPSILATRKLSDNDAYLGYAVDIAYQANSDFT